MNRNVHLYVVEYRADYTGGTVVVLSEPGDAVEFINTHNSDKAKVVEDKDNILRHRLTGLACPAAKGDKDEQAVELDAYIDAVNTTFKDDPDFRDMVIESARENTYDWGYGAVVRPDWIATGDFEPIDGLYIVLDCPISDPGGELPRVISDTYHCA